MDSPAAQAYPRIRDAIESFVADVQDYTEDAYEEIGFEEAWAQFTDYDEWINYSKLRIIVSQVANDVDRTLEVL